MSLVPPLKVGKLQAALHDKAKRAPNYRFYALYDKIWREDVLRWAWERCRQNDGSPGVDGQTFTQIEAQGISEWLGALTQQLRQKSYRPEAVRRVMIPKADGKQRPLGIPTIRDRVVQMAAAIVLEPIFEADLPPEQFGYRPERSAHRIARSPNPAKPDTRFPGKNDAVKTTKPLADTPQPTRFLKRPPLEKPELAAL